MKQPGKPGENDNYTTTKNPLTGEKVSEGKPTTEITTPPTDEILNSVEKKYHKVIKMSSIQTYQSMVQKKYQVNQELRTRNR